MQRAWVQFENIRSASLQGRSPWVWQATITVVGFLMLPVIVLAVVALIAATLVGLVVFWLLSTIDRLFGAGGGEQGREGPAEDGRVNVKVIDPNETN